MGSDVNKFYFRLVLLGSNGTGKTSILNRFLFKKFEPKHKPTVEDLFTKEFDLGSIEIKVDFLDTSGSMQFPAMRRLSITNGDAFLIVYSLDDENSFEVLKMCIAEIQETRKHDYQEIPIVFVGNKSDLPRDQRRVPKELVSEYVYYGLPRLRTKVIECSCKDNLNIDTIFRAYLSLARVSVSPSYAAAGGGKSAMATIDSGGSGGSGRSSRNNSGKRRPASAVPQIGEQDELATTTTTTGASQRLRHNSSSGGGNHSSSFRVALGVRKSCDASIVTSMRRISLSSKNSREQLETTRESPSSGGGGQSNDKHNNNNNNDSNNRHNSNQERDAGFDDEDQEEAWDNQRPLQRQQNPQKSSIESILKAAQMQNSQSNSKLHVKNHESKPRSRSLIWRPNRKSSQSSAANDQSECRIS